MRWIITDPRGVQSALTGDCPEMAHYEEPEPRLAELIIDQPPLSRSDRLSIYANGYLDRIVEALENDFDTIHRVLGCDMFRRLCSLYLIAHPSKTHTLSEVGKHLPEFIRSTRFHESHPFLADLAELDWVVVKTFFANDSDRLDLARLSDRSEDDWNDALLRLAPSVNTLQCEWNIDELWHAKESQQEALGRLAKQGATRLLVYRKDDEVWIEPLTPISYELLRLMRSGLKLESLTSALIVEHKFSADEVQKCLTERLGVWVREGVISQIEFVN